MNCVFTWMTPDLAHLRAAGVFCVLGVVMPAPKRPANRRSTTVAQGYGAEHAAERKRWQHRLDEGAVVPCACERPDCPHHDDLRCPTLISATSTWDLGHTDDRTGWAGPECVPCNRSAGARNSRASQSDPMTMRGWCEPIAVVDTTA